MQLHERSDGNPRSIFNRPHGRPGGFRRSPAPQSPKCQRAKDDYRTQRKPIKKSAIDGSPSPLTANTPASVPLRKKPPRTRAPGSSVVAAPAKHCKSPPAKLQLSHVVERGTQFPQPLPHIAYRVVRPPVRDARGPGARISHREGTRDVTIRRPVISCPRVWRP